MILTLSPAKIALVFHHSILVSFPPKIKDCLALEILQPTPHQIRFLDQLRIWCSLPQRIIPSVALIWILLLFPPTITLFAASATLLSPAKTIPSRPALFEFWSPRITLPYTVITPFSIVTRTCFSGFLLVQSGEK